MIQKRVSDLLGAIGAEPQVWMRFCAIKPDHADTWEMVTLDLTAGEEPPTWQNVYWKYPRAFLHAGVYSGQLVRQWLESGVIDANDENLALFELEADDPCTIERRASGRSNIYGQFAWPYDQWTIPVRNATSPSISDVLVGDSETPTFLNYNVAISALPGVELPPGGGFAGRSGVFRKQDLSGRISGVHVYPTEIKVDLAGYLLGAFLELASDRPGPVATILQKGEADPATGDT